MGNGGWKAAAVAATGPPARQRTVMPGSPSPPPPYATCLRCLASFCAPSRASAARGSRRTACRPGDPSRAGCRRPAGRRPNSCGWPWRSRKRTVISSARVTSARCRARTAAFLVHLFAGLVAQLRIDEDLGLVLFLADVDDHEALVHIHLAGGQADVRRVVHGLEHVVEQALEFGLVTFRSLHRHGLGARRGSGIRGWGAGPGHVSDRAPAESGKASRILQRALGLRRVFWTIVLDHLSGNQVDTAMFKCFRTVSPSRC